MPKTGHASNLELFSETSGFSYHSIKMEQYKKIGHASKLELFLETGGFGYHSMQM